MFIDTHAHLYKEYYSNIENIIKESIKNKVNYIINSGINYETNCELLDLAAKQDNVFITLGIHPECADGYKISDLHHIECHLKNSKVIGIGEIGLDYHYEDYNKEKQKELFINQLKLAEKYSMPIVVHSREATQDTIDILKNFKLKGIIHSFSGSKEVAMEYIKLGYKLGINGVVTFKNCNIKAVIKEVGIQHFVLETDSPYLTPVPFRGKQNSPAHIGIIADFVCKELNISLDQLSKITNANVSMIFDKFCE